MARALRTALAMALLAFSAAQPVHAAETPKAGTMAACFADLERGTAPDIVCEFPLQPSAAERAEMENQTSGFLKNAVCVVSIRIARALVTAAIETPEHVFQAPPQPVSCRVTTSGKSADLVTDITGTFAPKVTLKGGVATEALPGLANVKGVSSVIAWPAVAYINRAGFLRQGMLKVVNAWIAHLRKAQGKVVTR